MINFKIKNSPHFKMVKNKLKKNEFKNISFLTKKFHLFNKNLTNTIIKKKNNLMVIMLMLQQQH